MRRAKTAKTKSLFDGIHTRRPTSGSDTYSISLGGTTLYAGSERKLHNAVAKLEESILESTLPHQTLVRNSVVKLTREAIGEEIPDRVFGAVFGKMLKLGRIRAIPCQTINGRILRVYLNDEKSTTLDEQLDIVRHMLRSSTAVDIRTAQRRCFPERGWGTYVASQHLLMHLVFLGHAVYADGDLFIWPTEVEDAVCSNSA